MIFDNACPVVTINSDTRWTSWGTRAPFHRVAHVPFFCPRGATVVPER